MRVTAFSKYFEKNLIMIFALYADDLRDQRVTHSATGDPLKNYAGDPPIYLVDPLLPYDLLAKV